MNQDDNQNELLRLFEGTWLASPSGNRCYAKMVKGKLLIPYSRSEENKLAGHYFNCRVTGNKLVCQFERFEPYASGVTFLKLGPNRTLTGGWWLNENLPKTIQNDLDEVSDSLPKMVKSIWVLMPNTKIPTWAREYFRNVSGD